MTTAQKKHSAPFVKHPDSIGNIMTDVIIALLPSVIWSVYSYGARALSIILVSVVSAILAETVFEFVTKRYYTVGDLSATVTGILLALCLPATAPLYAPFFGSFFAILIIKCIFGGLGGNFLNPALSGFVFLKLAFPGIFELYRVPFSDILTGATPLSSLKEGLLPNESVYDILVGNTAGALGEGSAVLILAGGIYLLVRGIIGWQIPVAYVGTVIVIMTAFPMNVNGVTFVINEVISGGLLFGAFFMATDPVTSPITNIGKLIYGALCGGMTVLLRYYGAEAEGVAYAILLANLLTGILDKLTFPKRFGGRKTASRKTEEE